MPEHAPPFALCGHRAAHVLLAAASELHEIDATGMLVLPGLIDCHAHTGHRLVKTPGGNGGDKWYDACHQLYTVGSDKGFWAAEAELAAVERLKAGTTCGVSYLGAATLS